MKDRGTVRSSVKKFDLPGKRNVARVCLSDREAGMECSVIPAAGAEIASLRVKLGGRWREILYRALAYSEAPPDGWDGRAPLLWPAVGRTNTPEQIARAKATGRAPRSFRYHYQGRTWPMQMHGFVRRREWELVGCGVKGGRAFATCALRSSDKTRKMYPFDFGLTVTHTLGGGRIVSRYEVAADDANTAPMPFTIGNHIGFTLPFGKRGSFDECTIRTPSKRQLVLNEMAVLSRKSVKKDLSKPVPMSSGIWADTFLGGYTRRTAWAELADPHSITLRISQAERPVAGRLLAGEKDIHFVFWGSPDLGYFCPEPWIGKPNALNTGRGAVELAPGGRFVWEMRVQITRKNL